MRNYWLWGIAIIYFIACIINKFYIPKKPNTPPPTNNEEHILSDR